MPGRTQAAAGVPFHRQEYARHTEQPQAMLRTLGQQGVAAATGLFSDLMMYLAAELM